MRVSSVSEILIRLTNNLLSVPYHGPFVEARHVKTVSHRPSYALHPYSASFLVCHSEQWHRVGSNLGDLVPRLQPLTALGLTKLHMKPYSKILIVHDACVHETRLFYCGFRAKRSI